MKESEQKNKLPIVSLVLVFILFQLMSHILVSNVKIVRAQTNDLEKQTDWPELGREQKPWTRWWWMGNAVDTANITWHLKELNKKGIGGVEITPIYGVEGYENQFIDFLSPKWMQMLTHTLEQADKLDMGVDVILGTGWPYGGPWVSDDDAARKLIVQKYELQGGKRLPHRVEHINKRMKKEAPLNALMAYGGDGSIIDLTDDVSSHGELNWTAPIRTNWQLMGFFSGWTNQQVKRAAPGGEGYVVDHFSDEAIENYLKKYETVFEPYDILLGRAFFNDSYEVYGADWTPGLLAYFEEYQNYDLRDYLPAFLGKPMPGGNHSDLSIASSELTRRVRADYYETIHYSTLDHFMKPWVDWVHQQSYVAKNQAHGFPGNILDFYGMADIPEMEIFGQTDFDIPGLRQNDNLTKRIQSPSPLILKFASSAGHVEGKNLIPSETATWLDEHFRVSLSQVKPHIDMQMTAGINHMIYHGMNYSPRKERWPGWLFYASTNFSPSNTFWDHFDQLNSYLGRNQAVLQQGSSDNDILLYYPIYDLWHHRPVKKLGTGAGIDNPHEGLSQIDNLFQIAVGNPEEWFYGTPFANLAERLWDKGYTFDYISDRQLSILNAEGAEIKAATDSYKTLVVPPVDYMPLETLKNVFNLAKNGASIIFTDQMMPQSVPGLGDLKTRQEQLDELKSSIQFKKPATSNSHMLARLDQGKILKGDNIRTLLSAVDVVREPVVDKGIEFIRRKHEDGHIYFFTNLYGQNVDDWITLGTDAVGAYLMDANTGDTGFAALRKNGNGATQIRLELKSGASILIKTFNNVSDKEEGLDNWVYTEQSGVIRPIEGTWNVTFTKGEPELPEKFTTTKLDSWTELGGNKAKRFAGTASYSISFDRPNQKADFWRLSLGKVAESACVVINQTYSDTVWSHPFEIVIPDDILRNRDNQLTVYVTNLTANRIADMDRRQIEWAKFYDINFVNLDYQPFDASGWKPMDSGLMGPVTLTPLIEQAWNRN